ncbi:NADH-quinone oxidoreductase subunit NuoE [Sneathiella marina]|uniref:NADH-quinone oxidoreductase subunit NuoE n=1 Tax=Sneathiella marina TaxID=2950108 RepID=A0ABY4VXJ0_9PROT|nr:NADH-quinone oxidoreductase subunit NuoE [Sneathiella marina]USG59637.1 NADH-quinone oxidoreductase subunit NuoE [Sneathiella marina]
MSQVIETGKAFEFTPENTEKAKMYIARYPEGRQQSAVMPLLDLAQRQHENWLSRECLEYVGNLLSVPYMRVLEVATFYTMYNLKPVGKHFLQLCRTTPCWLRGSDDLEAVCKSKLGIGNGETTEDGQFSLLEVECLGACVNAPVVQINDDFYEDLDAENFEVVLDALAKGETPAKGPQIDRVNSAPEGGATTLLEKAGGA